MSDQVNATEAAIQLIDKLKTKYGRLIFHQSGGCCDGSSPMCFQDGELLINEQDVLLGFVNECPFYMSAFQYTYWKDCILTLDVVKGRGSSFSLEIPLGLRFVILSTLKSE